MNRKEPYRIVISGGGTGGHIYPAIAIANTLLARHADTEILFVGAKGRMEMKKVPEAGYKIIGLWISGLQRKLSLDNLSFPFKVISSVFRSGGILRKFKPHAVVGVGGYASGPLLYSATRKKIPALVQEQNSYAGLTNKILANKVQKICVAYEGMDKYFPVEKIRFTGNPVRKDIVDITDKREKGISHFKLNPAKKTILVIGGSLGARTINDAIVAGLGKLALTHVQLLWQSGSFYYQEMREKLDGTNSDNIHLLEFIKEMDLAYAAADIVISRAGALSISELCLVKKPVLFVPSPNVAEDHQTKNARALVDKNAAIMVRDADAKNDLVDTALLLLEDQKLQNKLSENIAKWGRPNAAEDIANEILKLIA